MRDPQRFSMPRTFLLGLGFLGVSVIWAMYNAYVPVFLKDTFRLSSTAIGFIMTIDNIIAPPAAGALIDGFGYGSLMVFSPILFAVAIVVVSLARRGEAQKESPSGIR